MVAESYIVVEAILPHTYPRPRNHGNPWEATYEYCCRNKHLNNNRETM